MVYSVQVHGSPQNLRIRLRPIYFWNHCYRFVTAGLFSKRNLEVGVEIFAGKIPVHHFIIIVYPYTQTHYPTQTHIYNIRCLISAPPMWPLPALLSIYTFYFRCHRWHRHRHRRFHRRRRSHRHQMYPLCAENLATVYPNWCCYFCPFMVIQGCEIE